MPRHILLTLIILLATLAAAAQDTLPTPTPSSQRIAGGVIAGNKIGGSFPRYPQEAKDKHISGSVLLHAIIGRDGTIQKLEVVSGNELLAQAAVTAVKDWTYRPYLLNGSPTEVDTTITVNFNLAPPAPPDYTNGEPAPARLIRISGGVMAANILQKVDPIYPDDARDQGVSGSVVLLALITDTGVVQQLTVVSGPSLLRKAALDAVRQWTFKPYLLNGQPTAVNTTLTVNFNYAP